jgi:hypothetical protein
MTITARNETRLNPPIGKCDCGSFSTDTPLLHELLLGFEDYDVYMAVEMVASLIGDNKKLGIHLVPSGL